MKKFLLALVLMVAAMVAPTSAYSQVVIHVQHSPVILSVPMAPACPYGYYDFYPYSCAPVGYYGSDWFVGGLFIGAGPWYGGHYNRYYHGHGFHGHPIIVQHNIIVSHPSTTIVTHTTHVTTTHSNGFTTHTTTHTVSHSGHR